MRTESRRVHPVSYRLRCRAAYQLETVIATVGVVSHVLLRVRSPVRAFGVGRGGSASRREALAGRAGDADHIPPCWETDQWRRQRERPVSGPLSRAFGNLAARKPFADVPPYLLRVQTNWGGTFNETTCVASRGGLPARAAELGARVPSHGFAVHILRCRCGRKPLERQRHGQEGHPRRDCGWQPGARSASSTCGHTR